MLWKNRQSGTEWDCRVELCSRHRRDLWVVCSWGSHGQRGKQVEVA